MNENSKKEILFYYESEQNPNGDPGFENQPRLMPDDTILVTDVRIKRTMRDYAKKTLGHTIFVDFDENGNAVKAQSRAEKIVKKKEDMIEGLLKKTFDTLLFGALVPIGREDASGDSKKLAGPCQFGIGRSVNKVNVINPTIVGRFVGKEKKGKEKKGQTKQYSTFGKFYAVEYALLKIQGIINPINLDKYIDNPEIKKRFDEAEEKFFDCLWHGTNNLTTRSKYPQRSVLYIEVEYDKVIYNDLSKHVVPKINNENDGFARSLKDCKMEFEKLFDELINKLSNRKDNIIKMRVASCQELDEDVKKFVSELNSCGIKTEEIKWE